jgi:hypothetical protein
MNADKTEKYVMECFIDFKSAYIGFDLRPIAFGFFLYAG